MARYNSNGSLDTSFGSSGYVKYDINTTYDDEILNFSINTSNNKIYAAGYVSNGLQTDFAMMRFLQSGQVDTTFNSTGLVTRTLAGGDIFYGSTVRTNDAVYGVGTDGSGNYVIYKFTNTGGINTTFASSGIFRANIGTGSICHFRAIKDYLYGDIVIAGNTRFNNAFFSQIFYMNPFGTQYATFGNGGSIMTILLEQNQEVTSLVLENSDSSSGKFLIAGGSTQDGSSNSVFVYRLMNGTGAFDTTFGNNGIAKTTFSNKSVINAIDYAVDKTIVTAGYTIENGIKKILIIKYKNNGQLDTRFGTNGIIIDNINIGNNEIKSVKFETNGKILVGGESLNLSNTPQISILKYNNRLLASYRKSQGATALTLLNENYPLSELLEAEYTQTQIKTSGYTVEQFKVLGSTALELRNIGFSLIELKDIYTVTQLKEAGYGFIELKNIGISFADLKTAFTKLEFELAGYTAFYYQLEKELPLSAICFLAGSEVKTDQGIIEIDKINPDIHTIKNKKIIAISKTRTLEKELIFIKKNSFDYNIPNKDTVITKNHKIFYNKQLIKAKELLHNNGIELIKYNGEILYNVLMIEENIMIVNNLIVETLNPKNWISKLYINTRYMDNTEKDKIIKKINKIILENNVEDFKSIIDKLN